MFYLTNPIIIFNQTFYIIFRSLTSIELLKNYIHLRYIDLSKNALRDVSPLSVLHHALTINLEENQISKINIEPIPYLQVLHINIFS